MGTSERPAASLRIDIQHFGVESLHERLDLGVVELPHIEMATIGAGRPSEENIGGGLHQSLPHHDALSVMTVSAPPGVRFEHRLRCLLELQKQRIVPLGHHQCNPAPASDAADADNLDRDIHEPVTVDKNAPVFVQRFPVALEKLIEYCCRARPIGALWMEDQRRLVRNADLSPD